MKRTGPTNPELSDLITELKTASIKQDAKIWKRVATDLEKPTRKRRAVNIARINRFTKEGEVIVVPGKVLGTGSLKHKLTVAAFSFSDSARETIDKSGKAISIKQLIKDFPKGQKVRILG